MALTAGTNCFTQAEDAMLALLAKSAGVRSFLGVSTEEEAYGRIFVDEIPRADKVETDGWDAAEYVAQHPCIILSAPADGKWFTVVMDARDNQPQYVVSYVFALRFQAFADAGIDEQEQRRKFKNAVLDGISDMMDHTVAEPDVFMPTNIEPLDGIYQLDFRLRSDLGHIMGASFLLTSQVSV